MYVHKYDTRDSHDLLVSDCSTFLYQNSVFIVDIKLYNNLLEKINNTHT